MRALAAVLLLTLLAAPAAAQTGTITGTVTNQSTGTPLAGITIYLYNSQGGFVTGVGTNLQGVYTISGLAAGSYYARAVSGTFIGELFDNLPCAGSCNATTGTPIPVIADTTTSGIDFALVAGGRITGTITDATTGLPVNGIWVEAYAANGALAGSSLSAGSGGYSINSLPAGTYTVRTHTLQPYYVDEIYNDISCDEVGCPLSAGQGIAVTSGVTAAGVNFALVPALPQLRVMYLRPIDRSFRPDYYRAVQNAMYELRAWYEEQMGGAMYSMATSRPEICVLPNVASYYPGDTRTKVSADALVCAPAGWGPSRALWVLYFDVEDACNDPGRLGVGGLGITWLGSGDMNGLIGAPVIDSCGQQFFQPINRYIGGAGHEIGHGFGLQHPIDCQQGLPTCDWGALMFAGYASYPNTYLRADEKVTLSTSPMFRLTNLLQNPSFSAGATGWQFFAAPDPFDIVWSVNNGVLEFHRNPPAPNASNQAVVLQPTGLAVAAGTGLLTQFDLGNSSSVRKRIAVLVHDRDFSDLSVCTFWLPPFAPLQRYSMRTHTTEAWTNATISFYAATPGIDGGAYRLDRVSMATDTMVFADRTECVDPTATTPGGGVEGPDLLTNGDFSAGSTAGWVLFGQIVSQVTGGVFEFVRPLATPDPAGVILQITQTPLAAGEMLRAQFDLGNSSPVRKRVTVLLHDFDFSDLHACTFWLDPGQALSTYMMRTFATKAWGNVTISVYAATAGDEPNIRLDNVSLRKSPASQIAGTDCFEPGGP